MKLSTFFEVVHETVDFFSKSCINRWMILSPGVHIVDLPPVAEAMICAAYGSGCTYKTMSFAT